MQIEPAPRQVKPLTDEERVERDALAAQWRAQAQANRDATIERTKELLRIADPDIPDLDAAARCSCTCHPQPGSPDRHPGETCACQLPPQDQAALRRSAVAALAELASAVYDESREREDADAVAAEAASLDVTASIRVGATPFVIAGTADGRGFYLRERHGEFRVTIAPDDTPGLDPWDAPASQLTIDIAAGPESALCDDGAFSPARALRVAVEAVRTYLRQRECEHHDARRYCPDCGLATMDAAQR